MPPKYAVYKGLQKPLIFKGFKGKFIYWGIGFLLAGLVFGALTMSLINMWLGAFVLIGCIVGGLLFTASKQKKGLHVKTRSKHILILNHYGRKNFV
ncbi:plasmid transfer protein [Mucilaginibacter sp. SMC90]|uniref:plasmid transfer protein n=1 Tax=Mucilaginibacter sp. SMC90 TaxID=2929803 RepID=UPI001FB48E24|nr:plasmid transfer protein [Mucilaginibacter sp. SMC90]UOE47830.1 plasmid transfer protein [Mucilaginibacter sp. SMC90]